MNAKPLFSLGALLLLCAAPCVAYGQYMPRQTPAGPPVFANPGANPYASVGSLPRPVHAAQGLAPPGQYVPVVVAPHLAVSQAGVVRTGQPIPASTNSENRQQPPKSGATDKPPYRIFVASQDGDTSAGEIDLAPTPPQNASNGEASYDGGCEEKSCGCKGDCGCPCYSFRFFGESLYLRTRNAEVAYAVEADSTLPNQPPIQTSPIALVDHDSSSGFRFGLGVNLDPCSELAMTYTQFDTAAYHNITRGAANRHIQSMVIHPGTPNAVAGTVSAAGQQGIDLELMDLEFRRILPQNGGNVTYVAGVRWGHLNQDFSARFIGLLPPQVGPQISVLTDIEFSGAGLRLGMETEQHAEFVPLVFYAKGLVNILAGEFDATYRQNHPNFQVNTGWNAGRIVPTFDLEVGTGYSSPNGRYRATIGYMLSVWSNVVKTDDFIHAVQTNDFRGMNDNMMFDGVIARVEGRF